MELRDQKEQYLGGVVRPCAAPLTKHEGGRTWSAVLAASGAMRLVGCGAIGMALRPLGMWRGCGVMCG